MIYRSLQNRIGYSFKDEELLLLALTHSSFANENHNKSFFNERIEFLGDAVLELISSEFFYKMTPEMPEGVMTKKRAAAVCEPALAFCAREIGLEKNIRLGRGEEQTGGRERDSIISDALESLIGAIYLDGGFEEAKKFVLSFVLNDLDHKKLYYDSKSALQEYAQGHLGAEPVYELIGESGPDHMRVFTMQVSVAGNVLGVGEGHTKKAAQAAAALEALKKYYSED